MRFQKYKKNKIDICNICQEFKPLTWDHVPPKKGIVLKPVEVERLLSHITKTSGKKIISKSNNGLRYRTLCKSCNSKLGTHCDKVLNTLTNYVSSVLKSSIQFPPIINIETQPISIIKAVIGHLVAARIDEKEYWLTEKSREFLLNDDAELPHDIYVYYWFHPFEMQFVTHNHGIPLNRDINSPIVLVSLLKYFPIGFMVTESTKYQNLTELSYWRNLKLKDTAEIKLDIRTVRGPEWPNDNAPGNFQILGADGVESIIAKPQNK